MQLERTQVDDVPNDLRRCKQRKEKRQSGKAGKREGNEKRKEEVEVGKHVEKQAASRNETKGKRHEWKERNGCEGATALMRLANN